MLFAERSSAMTLARQQLGILGETLAVDELTRRGYAILDRRYRTRHGEIDIIADHEGTLVFVEVKAREDIRCGTAAEAVTRAKQRRIVSRAVEYLARHDLGERRCRFDVVAIDYAGSEQQRITVYPHAFDATG